MIRGVALKIERGVAADFFLPNKREQFIYIRKPGTVRETPITWERVI